MDKLAFWKDAAERAVKTFAQSLVALIGAGAVNIVLLDWPDIFGISATAALVSVLTSVVSLPIGDNGSASLVSVDRP
jgi:hypothetical protein